MKGKISFGTVEQLLPLLSSSKDVVSMQVTQALDGEQVRQKMTAKPTSFRTIEPDCDLPLAYKIRGKVEISYAGSLVIAERLSIKLFEPEAKKFIRCGLVVAIARAYNPQTKVCQAGASQWDASDECAFTIAEQLALRNAIRKVVPLDIIHIFANLNAVYVPPKPLTGGKQRYHSKRRRLNHFH